MKYIVYFLKATTLLAVIFALNYYRPWLNDSGQAERAHGIALPNSAMNIKTVGDWRRGFLDRGASSTFTLAPEEVDAFIAKLNNAKLKAGAGPPLNERYHRGLYDVWESVVEPSEAYFAASDFNGIVTAEVIRAQESAQKPSHAYVTNSYNGDWLTVEVFGLNEDVSGIRMYTDWN